MWQADKLGYRGNTNYNRAYEGDELVWEKPTGDFYNLGGATYTSGDSGIPTGWTEHTLL